MTGGLRHVQSTWPGAGGQNARPRLTEVRSRGPSGPRGQAWFSSSTSRLRVRFGSTGTPGPIVVVMVAFLT
jgi:hypothetical protein